VVLLLLAVQINNVATLTPQQGSQQGSQTSSASATFQVIGCNVLPTIGLSNLRTWAAVTWNWQMQKQATPNSYQLQPGQGTQANYQVCSCAAACLLQCLFDQHALPLCIAL
jgi:hypothetical protein